MVIIRRVKDTLRPYDEIRLQQRIIGRRILSNKIWCLPFNQGWSMNFNEISNPSTSVITEKRMNNDNQYDVKQSKLKNMMIDELKNVFISRQQDNDINSAPILTEKYSIVSKKKIIQHPERIKTSNKAKTSLVVSNILLLSSNKFFNLTNFLIDIIYSWLCWCLLF